MSCPDGRDDGWTTVEARAGSTGGRWADKPPTTSPDLAWRTGSTTNNNTTNNNNGGGTVPAESLPAVPASS
jgi:hypothetical protein